MTFRISLIAAAMALSLPAAAQTYPSPTPAPGELPTSITGGTGEGTVSSSGVVVDPQADRLLLNQVVSQLASDPAIAGAALDVQVVGGRVTLNGAAVDTNQAEAAKEIAQGVAGAANVTSNVTTGRQ